MMNLAAWLWRLRRLRHAIAVARRSGSTHEMLSALRNWRQGFRSPTDAKQSGESVLVIDEGMPDPERDSGSVRMVEILRILSASGYAAGFMPHSGTASEKDIALARALGIELIGIPGQPDLPSWLAKRRPTAALLCRFHVANFHMALIRSMQPDTRILFDTVDLHYVRLTREAELGVTTAPSSAQLQSIKAQELQAIQAADATFVVSEVERELLTKAVPTADVRVLSNIHVVTEATSGFTSRRDLLFVGGMAHSPNLDAMQWFCHEVLPSIRSQVPDMTLHIVGAISAAQRDELSRFDGVRIHGQLPDLTPLLETCRISVAPLRYGAGVKGKVNLAMSHGLPVVMTSIAAEGMSMTDREDALIADNAADFAEAVLRLHSDAVLWQKLADAGKNNIRKHFSREIAAETLVGALPRRP